MSTEAIESSIRIRPDPGRRQTPRKKPSKRRDQSIKKREDPEGPNKESESIGSVDRYV